MCFLFLFILRIFIFIVCFFLRILCGVLMCLLEIWEIWISFLISGRILIKVLKLIRCCIVFLSILSGFIFLLIWFYGSGSVFLMDKEICLLLWFMDNIFIFIFCFFLIILDGFFIWEWESCEMCISLLILLILINVLKLVRCCILLLSIFLILSDWRSFCFLFVCLFLIIVWCERMMWFLLWLSFIMSRDSVFFL